MHPSHYKIFNRILVFLFIVVISSYSTFAQENTNRIIELLNARDWQNADIEIQNAIEINPDKEWLYTNQIWVKQNLKKYKEGIAIGKIGLTKWPESNKIKKGLSSILNASANDEINNKNFSEAIHLTNESLSLLSTDYSYYLLGKSYRELNDYKNAIHSFETGMKSFPNSKYFTEALPYTRYQQFKSILENELDDSLVMQIKNYIENSINNLDKLKPYKDNYYNTRIVSLGLRKLGNQEYFESIYQTLSKIYPNDPDVWDNYGFEYYALIRDKRAVTKEEKLKAISYRKKAIAIYEKINPPRKEITNVSFPMKGKYYILSQFEGSGMTHNGFAKYCYDFIRVDDNYSFTKQGTLGKQNSDYYNFGEKVYSIADGIVTDLVTDQIDNDPGGYSSSANYVSVDHNGYTSFYAHLKQNSINVKLGDKIEKGTLLGLSGNSGMSVESHLHFCLNDKNWVSIPFRFKKAKIKTKSTEILSDRPYMEEEIVEFK
jgi:murein DD-endopeptidase MepM/ murein hydrolase activator NlpD